MNKLVKRGLKAYNIFLKNKLAASLMMFIPGLMMTFAAIQGNGNDTKTLPLMILIAGAVFSLWACYRLGYMKSIIDKSKESDKEEIHSFALLIVEGLIYLVIMALGVFLLMNESFTNRILNLMAGGFTTFNGVLGAISLIKRRENAATLGWRFFLILTLFELVWGIYFILASESIGIGSYLVMGIITSIAGLIEVIKSLNEQTLRATLDDGKKIVKTLKEGDGEKE